MPNEIRDLLAGREVWLVVAAVVWWFFPSILTALRALNIIAPARPAPTDDFEIELAQAVDANRAAHVTCEFLERSGCDRQVKIIREQILPHLYPHNHKKPDDAKE